MAAGFDSERLKGLLVCSICLEQYYNPRTLKCNHDFCKECIENIVKFKEDGSAMITCPMRCPDETIIDKNQTINDLPISYNFKNIIEALKTSGGTSKSDSVICHYDSSCKNEISVHCCNVLMCTSCHLKHEQSTDHGQHKQKVYLSFSNKEDSLKVFCHKHVSKCTHLCVDNKFLCMYCIHRDKDHEKHSKNTIEREVALLKQALVNESNKKTSFDSIHQFLSVTEENIATSKEKYHQLLQQKKQKCLIQYNNFLNEEEEMLKNKFQRICDQHLTQYPVDMSMYCQEKLQKIDVELAIYKEEILDAICKNNFAVNNLKFESISVVDSFDFRSEHPLGDIEVIVGKKVSDSQPVSTLEHNFEVEENESEEMSTLGDDYERKLNILTEELTAQIDDRNKSEASYEEKLKQLTEENSLLKTLIGGQSISEGKIIKSPSSKNVQVFFDIVIGNKRFFWGTQGRIIINLFYGVVPKTCESFIQLCTHAQGIGYKGSKIHIVNLCGGYCVGGDITHGDGSGGTCIYGDSFPCENFDLKHNSKGTLSMWNSEGFTSSVFFINTRAQPEDDGKHVVFGKVTDETYHVVEKIMCERTELTRPLKDIVIEDCGILSLS